MLMLCGADLLQVGLPGPVGDVVGVADAVPVDGSLVADHTSLGHSLTLLAAAAA